MTETEAATVEVADSAGQVISDQLLREQAWEHARERSLEDKAGRMLTISIALLGLLASVIKIEDDLQIDEGSTKLFGAMGIGLLVLTAVAAVVVLFPRKFARPKEGEGGFGEYLNDTSIAVRPASYAARRVWLTQQTALASSRVVLGKKAKWLTGSMLMLVGGTLSLVIAVVSVAV